MQSYRLLIPARLLLMGITGCALKPPPWISRRRPELPPNTALVYFFRPRSPVAAAVSANVQDTAVNLGNLANGTYFVYHARPGAHTFMLVTNGISNQSLRLRAGTTYYLRGQVGQEGSHFPPYLTVVSPAQGQFAIHSLERLDYGE